MSEAWGEFIAWARAHWPGGDPGPLELEPIPADGSPRRFARLRAGGRELVAMWAPDNPAENRAWAYFAGLLGRGGLPVPRVLAADAEAGRFLMDDLGRQSLQEAARGLEADPAALAALYEPVLAMLADLQRIPPQELDQAVCFDGPRLDAGFLAAREAGYFRERFLEGYRGLGPEDLPPGLDRELELVSQRAAAAGPWVLVHRDFQSRNIIYEGGGLGLVDFQGARLGPAQYDLAALLHDPYVGLPWDLRARLRQRFAQMRADDPGFDAGVFSDGWLWVSLSRVMQALGAYGFLTLVRGRAHFAAHISPALDTWRRLAAQSGLEALGRLAQIL